MSTFCCCFLPGPVHEKCGSQQGCRAARLCRSHFTEGTSVQGDSNLKVAVKSFYCFRFFSLFCSSEGQTGLQTMANGGRQKDILEHYPYQM